MIGGVAFILGTISASLGANLWPVERHRRLRSPTRSQKINVTFSYSDS